MPDEMRKIIDGIVPPVAMFGDGEDGDEAAPDGPHWGGALGVPEAPKPRALLPRQEEFCRHYAAQPVATRAAVMAGYAERSAYNQGHRLLKQAEVLERIAALRAERDIRYAIQRDTMFDKLDGVFLNALGDRALAPAIAALRLQAQLAGLLGPRRRARGAATPPRAAAGAGVRAKNDEKKPARGRKMMRKGKR